MWRRRINGPSNKYRWRFVADAVQCDVPALSRFGVEKQMKQQGSGVTRIDNPSKRWALVDPTIFDALTEAKQPEGFCCGETQDHHLSHHRRLRLRIAPPRKRTGKLTDRS
jgi:hypothetical protein